MGGRDSTLTLNAMLIISLLLLPTASSPAPTTLIGTSFQPTHVGVEIQEDYLGDRERLMERLVKDLEELAGFCQKKRAFAQRNKVCTFILDYDTDHKDSRKTLGFKWDRKTKTWTAPKRKRTPKDADQESAVEAKQRYDTVLNDHRNRMIDLLDAHPDLPSFRADEEIAKLIKLMPEDPDLRRMRGQVKMVIDGKDKWVSEEFARTETRRLELKQVKKDLNDNKPETEQGSIEAWEEDLGPKWSGCNQTDRIRVIGTIGESERVRIAQQSHIMWDFMDEMTGSSLEHEYTIYVVSSDSDWSKMVSNWPDSNRDREFMMKLGGMWMGSQASLRRSTNAAVRIDSSLRGGAGMHLGMVYGISSDVAWLNEGFGLYQTKFLLGTRLTFSVKPSEYIDREGPNFSSRLSGSGANWLKMCRKLFERKTPPKIPFTLGRNVNQITADDILIGYALTAFLLEGCEKDTFSTVANKIGQEEMSSVDALESTLGYDIQTLTRKLQEWLIEVE
jgi:hypothetical protein